MGTGFTCSSIMASQMLSTLVCRIVLFCFGTWHSIASDSILLQMDVVVQVVRLILKHDHISVSDTNI